MGKITELPENTAPLPTDLVVIAADPGGTPLSQKLTLGNLKQALVLAKADVGLGAVDNTSDANKPVSTAAQTALNTKQNSDSDLTALAGLSGVEGDIIYRDATQWQRLPKGSANQVLAMNGGATAPAWATPAGGNDPRIFVKTLGADLASSSVTMVKATNLDQVCGIGTWSFEYRIMWQTTVAATAIKLGVNHSGTVTRIVVEATGFEVTTAASTGVMSAVGAAFGLRSGGQNNLISTTASIFGPTGVTTINVDHYAVIRGLIVVSVSGNLQLYFGSEATGSTQTLELPTSLILTKIA